MTASLTSRCSDSPRSLESVSSSRDVCHSVLGGWLSRSFEQGFVVECNYFFQRASWRLLIQDDDVAASLEERQLALLHTLHIEMTNAIVLRTWTVVVYNYSMFIRRMLRTFCFCFFALLSVDVPTDA